MKTIKKIGIIVVLLLLWAMMKYSVHAAVETNKIVTGTEGSIEFEFSSLALEEGQEYQWGISKFQSGEITNWYDVMNPDYTNGKVKLVISTDVAECLEVLKSTDTAYITVKTKEADENIIIDKEKVDLTIPLYKAYKVIEGIKNTTLNSAAYEIEGIYGMDKAKIQYNWVKITDPNIINSYVDNGHNLSSVPKATLASKPSDSDASWKTVGKAWGGDIGVLSSDLPKEDGLYYLWMKSVDQSMKTIYGCQVIEEGTVTKVSNLPNNESDNANEQEQKKDTPSNSGSNEEKEDPTVAPGRIAQAGISNTILWIMLATVTVGIVAFIRYKKLKDI